MFDKPTYTFHKNFTLFICSSQYVCFTSQRPYIDRFTMMRYQHLCAIYPKFLRNIMLSQCGICYCYIHEYEMRQRNQTNPTYQEIYCRNIYNTKQKCKAAEKMIDTIDIGDCVLKLYI